MKRNRATLAGTLLVLIVLAACAGNNSGSGHANDAEKMSPPTELTTDVVTVVVKRDTLVIEPQMAGYQNRVRTHVSHRLLWRTRFEDGLDSTAYRVTITDPGKKWVFVEGWDLTPSAAYPDTALLRSPDYAGQQHMDFGRVDSTTFWMEAVRVRATADDEVPRSGPVAGTLIVDGGVLGK